MMSGTVEAILREWAGEAAIIHYDPPTGAWLIVALHSLALGPAAGGTRMKPYPDLSAALEDAAHLSEGMTAKYAVHAFPRGGGKAVIAVPEALSPEDRRDLLRRHAQIVKALAGLYYAGPDVGTSPDDMDVLAEVAAPYVHCTTPERGGAGDSAPATALGALAAIRVTCAALFGAPDLRGRRILVQGAGSVGGLVIDHLQEAGADVTFSDPSPSAIARYRDERGIPSVPPGAVYDTPCDIFSPCALGGVLNEETVPHLRCRAVVGAANNQLHTPADAERLRLRGILYAPDFVVNIGGAMAITGIEALGWTEAEANARVTAAVQGTLARVYSDAAAEAITTVEAAQRIVDEHLTNRTSAPTS